MTAKEASKIRSGFCNGYEFPFGGGNAEKCDMEEVNRHAELLDEALKKQIAQKPERSDSGMFYICPSCQRFIERNEQSHGNIDIPFCKWCGQALDWEDNI